MIDNTISPDAFFAAFADATRYKLVVLLAQQPAGATLCVNALAHRLGVSQPAVSQHLQVLRNVGLVYAVRRGTRVHYHLNREQLEQGQALLKGLIEGLPPAPGGPEDDEQRL